MKPLPHPSNCDRRGAIVVLAAVMIVVLVGMVAFSVDYGYLVKVRTDLQRTADAAALAAVQDLVPRPDGTQDFARARTTARTYAADNLGDGSFQIADDDIEFGRFDPDTIYSNVTLLNDGVFDTVRITLRRDGESNPQVPLFFARVLGMRQSTITATATAVLQKADRLVAGTPILPFATPKELWDSLEPGDRWTAYGDGKLQDEHGQDVPGNWGTLDIGSTDNSTSELVDQINNGLRQHDLDALHADGRIPQDGYIDSSDPTWMQGDPGLSSGLKSAVIAAHGQQRVIPIYSALGGQLSGNNVEIHVVGWGVGRVIDSRWQGDKNTYVLVEKAYDFSGRLRTAGDLSSTEGHIEGGYTSPVLVE